jgi:hypothetical protein
MVGQMLIPQGGSGLAAAMEVLCWLRGKHAQTLIQPLLFKGDCISTGGAVH